MESHRGRYVHVFVTFAVILVSGTGAVAEPMAGIPIVTDPCLPSAGSLGGFVPAAEFGAPPLDRPLDDGPRDDLDPRAPPLLNSFEGINFEENGFNTEFLHIPPDPIGAAGPDHVVSVVNCSIEWFTKSGTLQNSQRLGKNASTAAGSFFASVNPVNSTFDPKVIYDQHDGRFVVVTLERTSNPSNTSRILVAVSDDSDPNGTWHVSAINSKINISGADRWADYPGFAVDADAVYITNNMFSFGNNAFGGTRLWIINKTPWYSGGAINVTVHDPASAVGEVATTMQPAHMYGATPAGVGTFLVRYSGYTDTDTGIEFLSIIRVDNPLGAVSFTHQFVEVGDIDNALTSFPGVPQSGTTTTIDGGDRRALHAVWRNNALWTTASLNPSSGADAGQVTAHWFKVDTTMLDALSMADHGDISGNDVAPNAHTFYPSITVDGNDNMAIGFALSAPTIFAGAYYTVRASADDPGTVQPTGTLAEGMDPYVRTFGSGRNRWGDYSGISIDPADEQSFWIFNEYALPRGTEFGGEDGRWGTRWGQAPFPAAAPICTIGPPSPNPVCTAGTVDYPVTYASNNGLTVNLLPSNVTVNSISGSIAAVVTVLNGTTATPTVRLFVGGQGSFNITIEPGRAMDLDGGTDAGATEDTPVNVTLPPTTATVGGSQTICSNHTTAGLGGNAPQIGTGAWSIVTGGFTGTFSPSVTAPNATFTQTGGGPGNFVLRWTISSVPCPPSSADVAITSIPSPAAMVGGPQTICSSGTTSGLGGNAPTTGTGIWSVVSGGTGIFSSNTDPNATFTHAGGAGPVTLRWTVSDPPCSTSADVTLSIIQPPTTATVGGSQTICTNNTTAGLGGNTPTTGTGAWSIVTGGVTGTFNPSAATPNATFTYLGGNLGDFVLRWTISNAPCPASAANVTITGYSSPIATAGGPQTICSGGTTVGLGGNTPTIGTGSWSIVSGGTGIFGNAVDPNATFTHTGGNGPIVARWTVNDPPCSTSANVTLTIVRPPTAASVGEPQTICVNGTTAGLGGNIPTSGTGTWSVVSGGTGIFSPNNATANATFTQTGGSGGATIVLRWSIANAPCIATTANVMVTVSAPSPPTITQAPVDQAVCAGSPVVFEISAASPTPVSYQWRRNGLALNGATGRMLSIKTVTEEDVGEYEVVVTNQCSQSSSASALLGMYGVKIAGSPGELTAPKCKTVTFSVLAEGRPPYTYQWRRDGVPLIDDDRFHGSLSEMLSVGPVIRTDSGAYDVIVSTACGDLLSDAAVLVVNGNTDLNECSQQAGVDSAAIPCAQGVLGVAFAMAATIVGWGAWRRRRH